MSFNLYVIVAAAITALAAVVAGLRFGPMQPVPVLTRTAIVGAVGWLVANVIGQVAYGPDGFASVHITYLTLTVAVPATAAILLARSGVVGPSRWYRAALMLALLFAPIGVYATHIEPFWLRVDRATVAVDGPFDGRIKVAVLSDLQTTAIGEYEQRAIEILLAEQPDLVLIPGDFYQMPSEEFEERLPQFAAVMDQLSQAVPHVVAVNGDTDTVAGLRRLTQGTDVHVLDNEYVDLTIGGAAVRIAGYSLFENPQAAETLRQRFLHEPGSPRVRLVLAHRPDEISRFSPADHIDLITAGHTHGGQVSLPVIGPPLTLTSVPRSVAAGGFHTLDEHPIYVSTGVGRERHMAPQMRFGVRPSLGIIELVPDTAG